MFTYWIGCSCRDQEGSGFADTNYPRGVGLVQEAYTKLLQNTCHFHPKAMNLDPTQVLQSTEEPRC